MTLPRNPDSLDAVPFGQADVHESHPRRNDANALQSRFHGTVGVAALETIGAVNSTAAFWDWPRCTSAAGLRLELADDSCDGTGCHEALIAFEVWDRRKLISQIPPRVGLSGLQRLSRPLRLEPENG